MAFGVRLANRRNSERTYGITVYCVWIAGPPGVLIHRQRNRTIRQGLDVRQIFVAHPKPFDPDSCLCRFWVVKLKPDDRAAPTCIPTCMMLPSTRPAHDAPQKTQLRMPLQLSSRWRRNG